MPPSPNPGNWTNLWVNNPFLYVPPGASRGPGPNSGRALNLEVLGFQELTNGTWKVRIRSASRRGWYSEGDAFESYEILSIDGESECIIVYAEELDGREEICIIE